MLSDWKILHDVTSNNEFFEVKNNFTRYSRKQKIDFYRPMMNFD